MTRQWMGVLEEYGDRLDIPEGTPTITLREGGTPLVESIRRMAFVRDVSSVMRVEGAHE